MDKEPFSANGIHTQKSCLFKVDDTCWCKKRGSVIILSHSSGKIEKHSISDSLVINFDQTPSTFFSVARTILAKRNTKQVYVKGGNDNRAITAIFAVEGQLLRMQLIYGGKANHSLQNFKFLKEFLLSVNPMHYRNETESMKFINEILVPCI